MKAILLKQFGGIENLLHNEDFPKPKLRGR